MAICKKCNKATYGVTVTCPNCFRIFHRDINCVDSGPFSTSDVPSSDVYRGKPGLRTCAVCEKYIVSGNMAAMRFCSMCGSFLYSVHTNCIRSGYDSSEGRHITP